MGYELYELMENDGSSTNVFVLWTTISMRPIEIKAKEDMDQYLRNNNLYHNNFNTNTPTEKMNWHDYNKMVNYILNN